jgi:FG-GAP repeat
MNNDARRQGGSFFITSQPNCYWRVAGLLIALVFGCFAPIVETHAATLTIVNQDGPGEGFNDSTPFTPVGGNTAMTLGQARRNAFDHAATILAQMLVSTVVIQVDAQIDPLGPGILGSAGPNTVHRNFSNALLANTWYVQALANKLAGQDLDPNTSDINATFSSDFSNWYYGLDANPPVGKFDFVTVVLHEITHGLGFLPLVDVLTGEKFLGDDDVYMRWLEHHGASPTDFPSMTNIQRQAASIAEPDLHFVGANLQVASGILTAGSTGTHIQMYAPNPVQPGSSISHFTNTIKPDQLMEPGIASGKAIHDLGLAQPLLQDLGWMFGVEGNFPTLSDVDGDGKADLVWRHMSSGEVAIWLMNGPTIASSGLLGGVPLAWEITGTGDVNGDGKADIIWRNNQTGTVAIWLMNGLTLLSTGFPASTSTDWKIQN